MRELGLRAYRFSISWSRVLPEGRGAVNAKGLGFYDRLVDALCAAGIHPFCTLFHWDLPQALQRSGGFLNRDVADWFADFAALLGEQLGDRVKLWVTQNEPQCFIGAGLLEGRHAPGLKLAFKETLHAAHNSMRAHGKAVSALRSVVDCPRIGYVVATWAWVPSSYLAEGIPFAMVIWVAGTMFKDLGRDDGEITLATASVGLAWSLKPLWAAFLDMFKTKRFFVLGTQYLMGVLLGGIALLIQIPDSFWLIIAGLWVFAFTSATQDI